MRIGALEPEVDSNAEDDDSAECEAAAQDEVYVDEPSRSPLLHKVLIQRPFCSETHPEVLAASHLTPPDALYVRNHAPVPAFSGSIEEHSVVFSTVRSAAAGGDGDGDADAEGDSVVEWSIGDLLARCRRSHVTSVLQCAGNRASDDIAATGPSGFVGTPFEAIQGGMVGNCKWSGVALADVLPLAFPEVFGGGAQTGSGGDNADVGLEGWHVIDVRGLNAW